MDSLESGDSLVMLWLVSWLTHYSLHRIVVTQALAFGKVKAAEPEKSAMVKRLSFENPRSSTYPKNDRIRTFCFYLCWGHAMTEPGRG